MDFEEIVAKMQPEHAAIIREAITKAKAEVPSTVTQDLVKAKEDLVVANEAVTKACGDKMVAEKKAKDLQAKIDAEDKKDGGVDEMTEVMKGLDPTVQAIFKSLSAQKTAAEAIVKQMNDQKVTDEALAKAKELKAIPVEESKLVEVIKGASPEVLEILKAANAAIITGGEFTEVGKSKGNDGNGNSDAWTKVEKKAGELMSLDAKLTKEAAITKTIKDNPDLYRQYMKGGM